MKISGLFTVIILTFLILNPDLFAQDFPRFGIKAGYLSSNISVDKFDKFSERRDDFSAGLYSKVFSIDNFSLILQLDYLRKGFNEIQHETDVNRNLVQTVSADTRLDYLSFPVMIS